MQIYKTFLKLAMRSIGQGIMYIGIFLGVSFGIANSQNSSQASGFTADKLDIAVIDRDNSTLSQKLYAYLDDSQKIKEMADNNETWLDELFSHTVEYVLVIENGFEAQMKQGADYKNGLTSYCAPDSNSSYIIASQVESWCQNINYYLSAGYDLNAASEKADEICAVKTEVSYLRSNGSANNTTPLSVFFNFMPYIMLCTLINVLGPMLIIWNRPEIKARTAISGLSNRTRNCSIIAAAATCAVLVMVIFMGICANVYKKDFFVQTTVYYVLNTLCCLAVCVATTFLIAQLSRKVQTLSIWSNLLGLSSSFLCGVFVERSLLPEKVVSFSKCLPTYWYINVAEELRLGYSGSLSSLAWRSMGIQLLFAAAITAIAFVVIRLKQQKNT